MCVCVDKSFFLFPFGQQKFGSTLRHCVAWKSGKSVKSGRDVRFFCGAELLCERRRRRRRRHAGCSGLAARANHPQPLGRSWIALPSWRYELIRLYRLLFLFYFFSILKQSSIATKSPSPPFFASSFGPERTEERRSFERGKKKKINTKQTNWRNMCCKQLRTKWSEFLYKIVIFVVVVVGLSENGFSNHIHSTSHHA